MLVIPDLSAACVLAASALALALAPDALAACALVAFPLVGGALHALTSQMALRCLSRLPEYPFDSVFPEAHKK